MRCTLSRKPIRPRVWAPSSARLLAGLLVVLLAAGHSGRLGAQTREPEGIPIRPGSKSILLPNHQMITPAGIQVELPGLRPQALALSPNGRLLVTAGKTAELVVIDPRSGRILQRVPLPSDKAIATNPVAVSSQILDPDTKGQVSFTGLTFSPDGSRLYLSNVNGNVKVFRIDSANKVSGLCSIPLPPAQAPKRQEEIPAGLALSPEGKRLYVVLNLSNRLAELEATTGHVLRQWDVGVAPYDVVLAGAKAYVSNWGGRRPAADSVTGPAGQGTLVRVDPVRYIANEGSVSVIDLALNRVSGEIPVGLHASALALSSSSRYLAVANAGSDTVSVIDTRTDQVTEIIWTRQHPADLLGASPNALAFNRAGTRLYVANGTQNAVAVIDFSPGKSTLLGLVPVGWFPGAIVHDAARQALYVANIKGLGSTDRLRPGDPVKFNSHHYFGTLSLLPVPSKRALANQTRQTLRNNRQSLLETAFLPPRPNQPARPVPERVGEPSVFQHVIYVIKENRTYDQVLGDVPQGNGDRSLCVFGENITPNQHKMVREFGLLDNTYCSGVLSADGHQWADSAFVTDYLEKSFAGFPRSYPDGMEDSGIDALAYSPAGFIWDNAMAHGQTLRDYGEFAISVTAWKNRAVKRSRRFLDYYRDFVNQTDLIRISSRPAIDSLRPYLNTNTVGWELNIPDVFRAAQFIKELRQFEQQGEFPNLVMICLPNDHTSGTKAGSPTPRAQVADNDLAFGQIVEAVSHSRFWKETCVIAMEDDPQAGWDHVSAYRTTAYVISPYNRRGQVMHTPYNQTSVLRTIELILGLPPMNQFDATATPMSACFTHSPNFTPFVAVPNQIPLDQMNPEPKKISDPLLRRNARDSARLPLEQVDRCPEDQLNRILWHALKGSGIPYPAWAASSVKDD